MSQWKHFRSFQRRSSQSISRKLNRTTTKTNTNEQALDRTVGQLHVRGKIHWPKVEDPKFEGHVTPNGDECKKSVMLKFRYCVGVS